MIKVYAGKVECRWEASIKGTVNNDMGKSAFSVSYMFLHLLSVPIHMYTCARLLA
jgi:hypothetical protein